MKHWVRSALASVIAFNKTCLSADGASDDVVVNATAGVTLPDDPLRFGMLEIRRPILHHLSLTAAATYLDRRGTYEDAQLRLGVIATHQVQAWTVENRHLFVLSDDAQLYRCRLRVLRSLGSSAVSLRMFDELYVDLNHGLARNTFSLGLGAQMGSNLTAELYQVWVDNRGAAGDDYVLALLTLRL